MMANTEVPVNANPALQASDRRCENPDCNVNKLISMVPKRKTAQFIAEPKVLEKPMLVNGFTAVFQVEGGAAKLIDIKNPNGEGQSKPIYRVVPNTHVHVVNYVVVDTDETYLRKITENDPTTMQKLLTSQKESAEQMLKKIMAGQYSATTALTTVVSAINNNNSSILAKQVTGSIAQSSTTNAVQTAPTSQNSAQKPAINLPVRMHPNLKITAVASAEGVTPTTINSNIPSTSTGATYITPVPITSLQAPPSMGAQPAVTINANTSSSTSVIDTVDKATYDKMQAEINDLRRTVAMLAEAQAKNQQQSPGPSRPGKRPRLSIPK